jgi:hypothetical protein
MLALLLFYIFLAFLLDCTWSYVLQCFILENLPALDEIKELNPKCLANLQACNQGSTYFPSTLTAGDLEGGAAISPKNPPINSSSREKVAWSLHQEPRN